MSYIELFYPATEQTSWMGRGPSSGSDTSRYYANSYGRSSYPSSAVVLHVSMCCEKCAQKVRKSLKNVDDIESVDVDMQRQKVIVRGYANPEKVLRKVQKVKKSATYWDSSHDYANYSTGAYTSAYHVPSSSAYDYDYYSPRPSSYDYNHYSSSPSYDYSYNYPNSHDDYSYNYPSSYEYSHNNHRHHHNSYDAYRYR